MTAPAVVEKLKRRVQAGQEAYTAGRLDEAVAEWSSALRSAQRLNVPEAFRTAFARGNPCAGCLDKVGGAYYLLLALSLRYFGLHGQIKPAVETSNKRSRKCACLILSKPPCSSAS